MPLYEYECESCGRRFERIQKFSDPLVEICPHCGGKVHKLISSPAIQFKGSGWYITDYSKKGSSGESSKSSESTSGEKTSSTSDAAKPPDSSSPGNSSTSTSDSKPTTKN